MTLRLTRWPAFNGLAVTEAMKKSGVTPWRGVQIIDLRNGDIAEWVQFEGEVTELFDVAIMSGLRYPAGLTLAPELADVVGEDEDEKPIQWFCSPYSNIGSSCSNYFI